MQIFKYLLDRFGIFDIFALEFFELAFGGTDGVFQLGIFANAFIVLVADLYELRVMLSQLFTRFAQQLYASAQDKKDSASNKTMQRAGRVE